MAPILGPREEPRRAAGPQIAHTPLAGPSRSQAGGGAGAGDEAVSSLGTGTAASLRIAAQADDPAFAEEYRRLAGHMPRPVAVLGVNRRGLRHAITVDSFLDVSYDPPTMAVSVYGGSRMAESLASVGAFSLSILTAEQKGTAQWLGEPGQPLRGPLDTVATFEAPSGAPVVSDCAAWFDLAIAERFEAATHDLVIGTVTALGPVAAPPRAPLVRWDDGYHSPVRR